MTTFDHILTDLETTHNDGHHYFPYSARSILREAFHRLDRLGHPLDIHDTLRAITTSPEVRTFIDMIVFYTPHTEHEAIIVLADFLRSYYGRD